MVVGDRVRNFFISFVAVLILEVVGVVLWEFGSRVFRFTECLCEVKVEVFVRKVAGRPAAMVQGISC